jgi:hypothetical protein
MRFGLSAARPLVRNGTRRRRVIATAAMLATVAASLQVGLPAAYASSAGVTVWNLAKPCPSVLVIGARGTGEEDGKGGIPRGSATLGMGPEVYGFASRLATIVANKGKGTVAVLNNPYPAIPVSKYIKGDPDLLQSVDQGVTNTRVLVRATVAVCGTATEIVLAGYSQGAMVASDGADFVTAADRPRVAALVLIADPGYSATDHGTLVGTAARKNGIIGPASPPTYLKNATVSVCDKGDAVCQADPLDLLTGGALVHTHDYKDPVLQAAAAAMVYTKLFPRASGPSGGGSTALDLVFAIDTTGSMSPYIASAVASANSVLDALRSRGIDFRIGVVDYKDADGCGDYDAVTDLPFSTSPSAIQAALTSLQGKVSGGCDTPEDVLSGVDRAISFPWRNGVKKVVIQMGDAPGKDPEPHSGLTLAKVAAHARAVDPAIVYPILVGSDPEAHDFDQALATATEGQTFDATADPASVGPVIVKAIESIVADAGLQFEGTPGHLVIDATGPHGATVTFDAPTVSDGTNAPPVVTCNSTTGLKSGSTFPIGDTTVTCTASDPDDNPSTVTLDFVVTVNGPLAQLETLLRVTSSIPHRLDLRQKVSMAIFWYHVGRADLARMMLKVLAEQVRMHSGRYPGPQLAAYIQTSATRIEALLSCETRCYSAGHASGDRSFEKTWRRS